MYTRHGWHIDGTVLEDRPIGLLTQDCGGPMGGCTDCEKDSSAIEGNPPAEKPKPKKVYYTRAGVQRLWEILNGGEAPILDTELTFRVVDALQNAGIHISFNEEA